MKYTLDKKDVTVEVTLTITAEEWAQHCDTAFNRTKNKYAQPGFRKGHVPRKILENIYGKQFLFDDALEVCFPEYYGEAIDSDKDLEIISHPDLLDFKVNDDGSIFVKAQSPIKPSITLGAYTNLTIEKADDKLTEVEFDAEINKTLEKYSRKISVENRPVADGDEVTIDYSGSVDGVVFDGGTANEQKLVIGSNSFIPGFEAQVIGMEVGQERDINVKFPEDYNAEELKGKDSVFHIKLHKIEKKELAQLTDDFVKDISEFDNVDAYKSDVFNKLQEAKTKRSETLDENKLVETITENATVAESKVLIEREIDYYQSDFERMLKAQGIKFEDYVKYTHQTREVMREENRERATKAVKTQLVIDAIITKENLTATETQTNDMIAKQAADLGKDVETFKAELREGEESYLNRQATIKNFFDFIKANNSYVEATK
ncbi:MAG: trigger factor [Clostridia bacterium]